MSNLAVMQFNDTNLDIIDRNGQQWMQSPQIATALGYKQANAVTKIFNRNSEEFTKNMVSTIDLPNMGKQRIFSLRGAHLIGMFARTKKAKEFRQWVLNILESHQADRSELPSTITPAQKGTLLAIMDARCADVPAMRQGSVRARMWRVVNRHNGVNSYHETTATAFEDTKAMLETMDIKLGEVVEQKAIKDEPTVSMAGKIPVSESTLIAYKRVSRKVADAYKQVESIEQELHLARHHFDKAVTGMRNFRKASWDVVNDAAFLAKIL